MEETSMKRLTILFALTAALFVLVACEKQGTAPSPVDKDSDHVHQDDEAHDHAATSADPHEGHDHAEDSDDDGTVAHADGEAVGHDHGGEAHPLGTAAAGPYSVGVTQIGGVSPGADELVFEIVVSGAVTPAVVRAVVRSPDGAESLKVKADKTGDGSYDAHVGELPETLPAGSQIVVEIAGPDGSKATASFDLATH
jgi:hypothetical protein